MKKRRIIRHIPILLLCLSLSACSAGASTDSSQGSSYSGMDYLEAGDYKTAKESFQTQIDSGSGLEDAYRGLGLACMGLGDYESAATALESALDAAGAFPGTKEYDINYYLGTCYYKLAKYDKALEVYDAIVNLRPRDADAYVLRGTVKAAQGDTAGMESDYRTAIDLAPTDYDRIEQIYEKMTEAGDEETAKTYISDVLQSQADTIDDYNAGRLAYCIGDYSTAKSHLENISTNRTYEVTILLGRTYEALGDFNYAISVYQGFLDSDQTHAEVYNQLGLCQLQMGNYQDALTAFQNGLSVGESEITQSLQFNQIVAYEYLGDFSKAKVLMEDYLKSYPGDENAKREETFLATR